MHKTIALLFVLTFTALVPATAAAERAIGFGVNMAAGIGYRQEANLVAIVDKYQADEVAPNVEIASFEIRLFPRDDSFSIDMQWYLLQTILGLVQKTYPKPIPVFNQNTYFHFHFPSDGPAAFAVAPSFIFATGEVTVSKFVTVGAGCRVGMDISSPARKFGLGVYFRPAVFGTKTNIDSSDFNGLGFAMQAEVTWTFYALRK